MIIIRRLLGRGFFKTVGVVGGIALIVYVGYYYPPYLTKVGDANLWLISAATKLVPGTWGGIVENGLRFGFAADRAMLLVEAAALVKLALWPVTLICRQICGDHVSI
jgi:hypothetical protein